MKDTAENEENNYKEKKTVCEKDERALKNLQEEVEQLERTIAVKNHELQKFKNEYHQQKSNNRVGEVGESVQVRVTAVLQFHEIFV